MTFEELVKANRSYRRFDQKHRISSDDLIYLINLTRYVASGKNNQTLKYCIVNSPAINREIFEQLAWAGYLKDWDGPAEGERPSAYIVVFRDNHIASSHYCDDGIAIQTILLGAVEKGLGGCIIGAFNKNEVIKILKTSQQMVPLYVLALGKPVEKVVVDPIQNDDVLYWRDVGGVHHVPKRPVNELIINVISDE